MSIIEKVYSHIMRVKHAYGDSIQLLTIKPVIQWLFGDTSFFPPIERKNKTIDTLKYKKMEDEFGRAWTKIRRPDLKLDGQWTNKFGEHIAEELMILMGNTVSTPSKKNGFHPDLQTETHVIEVKTQTYHTTGTAGEKIAGVPFKYSDVPILYGKPL
jgi:hypothetical protein